MCGISGFFSRDGIAPSLLENMTECLIHRGPDDRGFAGIDHEQRRHAWKDVGNPPKTSLKVGLGFRRLAILDLSQNGAQPMVSRSGNNCLIFNGQIYNYVELREKLRLTNLRSTSDTEVLLEILSAEGMNGLTHLNGIFAFAFWNGSERKLYLARDPVGIKPLYYYEDARGIFFASEIKSLLKTMTTKPSLRRELILRYLSCGWIPDPDTLFSKIYRLEPGHYLEIADGKLTKHRYWDLSFAPNESPSEKGWESELNEILGGVIERQMRSDVPLGFFLSGGVDSSLLASLADKKRKTRPSTFTVGFRFSNKNSEKDFNLDLETSRQLSASQGWNHEEVILEPSVVSLFPKIAEILEEPMNDPAGLCAYLLCREARKKFTVMISGHGADEIFGGYPLYKGGKILEEVQRLPKFSLDFTREFVDIFGPKGSHLVYSFRKLLSASKEDWPISFLRLRSALWPNEMDAVLLPDVAQHQEPGFAIQLEHFKQVKNADALSQMMYLDFKSYLVATNLCYTDKTSMANSVELRVPFLDLEVLKLIARLPSRYKVGFKDSKILLKKLARQYLPSEVITRKKTGFGLPISHWLKEDLFPVTQELLAPERLRKQGIFEPNLPHRWLESHREGTEDHFLGLFLLLAFQQWVEVFDLN